jgi:vitellogenic carboxypeptidase-like protein
MKILLLAALVVAISCGLYTSDHFAKQGIDVRSPIPPINPILKTVSTSCNNVALGTSPYNYDGVVKSGYLSTSRGNSALAFIFYGKEGAALPKVKNYPTLIWLNGGPGSSSQLGNLMELGPFWVVPDIAQPYKIVRNNYTWVKEYNVLFVDQPVGTGLSYADTMIKDPYVHNMTGNITHLCRGR